MNLNVNKDIWVKCLTGLIASSLLSLLMACGSGSSRPSPEVEVVAYAEKISNLVVTQSVVIFAVEVADNRFELFSVDPVTGTRTGISDTFSANAGLRPVALSPDLTRVGYRADKDNDGFDELYSNLIDGSNEVLLSSRIATATVSDSATLIHYNWQWSPDSSKIIFRSDPDSDAIFEIQSISPDGTNWVELSANLSVACFASACWKIAGNASHITFLVEAINQTSQLSQNIYSAKLDGSGLVLLNQPLTEDSRIHDWHCLYQSKYRLAKRIISSLARWQWTNFIEQLGYFAGRRGF